MNAKAEQAILTPLSPGNRIESLDVLRGFAVMGILAVNIQSFASIFMSIVNPTAYGDFTGLNKWVYFLIYTFAQQKFMTLFSLLFGAGVFLMSRNIEKKGKKPAKYHYRRMLWLILIGLLHAYVIWYGDILVSYGLCGLWVYLLRKKSPKTLFIVGMILIIITSLVVIFFQVTLPHWPVEAQKDLSLSWSPDQERLSFEMNAYTGDWPGQLQHRVPAAFEMQVMIFFLMTVWRAGGMMLIGMALFKWKLFENTDLYKKLLIIGVPVGLILHIMGWNYNMGHNWEFQYSMFGGGLFVYWGSLFMAMAYIGGVLWLCRSGTFSFITGPIAAMGRMAFTNYLMQSIICTFIFYGHGLGLFGKVERVGQAGIFILVILFQLWFSSYWLKRFRYGPVEWLWRTLSYGRKV